MNGLVTFLLVANFRVGCLGRMFTSPVVYIMMYVFIFLELFGFFAASSSVVVGNSPLTGMCMPDPADPVQFDPAVREWVWKYRRPGLPAELRNTPGSVLYSRLLHEQRMSVSVPLFEYLQLINLNGIEREVNSVWDDFRARCPLCISDSCQTMHVWYNVVFTGHVGVSFDMLPVSVDLVDAVVRLDPAEFPSVLFQDVILRLPPVTEEETTGNTDEETPSSDPVVVVHFESYVDRYRIEFETFSITRFIQSVQRIHGRDPTVAEVVDGLRPIRLRSPAIVEYLLANPTEHQSYTVLQHTEYDAMRRLWGYMIRGVTVQVEVKLVTVLSRPREVKWALGEEAVYRKVLRAIIEGQFDFDRPNEENVGLLVESQELATRVVERLFNVLYVPFPTFQAMLNDNVGLPYPYPALVKVDTSQSLPQVLEWYWTVLVRGNKGKCVGAVGITVSHVGNTLVAVPPPSRLKQLAANELRTNRKK